MILNVIIIAGRVYLTKEFELYLENNYHEIAKRLYDNAVESTAKLYFFVNGGDLPKVFAGIMGETNASLQLTNDTLLAVHSIKSKLLPFCKTEEEVEQTFVIFDSKVILFNDEKTKWSEEWDIKASNQMAKVKISFQLDDGKGGAYYTLNESEIIKHK
ncbi:hypothetical protein NF27_EY00240 [Candidatus Jidaibacter acanthamoeba]|uniref:Uncharacterized protein n=1 Tax=Candidatus Jidaibacter acanthamoebae TaxID=86105 RepID=A0A0C1QLE1_9RICK|nr:hypothetical protein [Candidatus Jidaibacter acanthamoeba]KIE04928.1 hypothetical protein NF27_EY00240 [Candidatus Jidaibacter acanthamoeba]